MKSVILIDLSSVFWAAWHATADQEVSAAYETTLATVRRLAEDGDYCAVCCDAPPYWRKQIAPSYKAQRDAPEPNAVEQLRRVKERLRADGILLWSSEGFEADDVIATATDRALSDGLTVIIATGDKDLLQLVSDGRVTVTKTNGQRETFNEQAVYAKFGVPPSKMRDALALMGDKSDNVPGVPGIGPKNAAKLLHDFGTVEQLLERWRSLPEGKVRDSIGENLDAVRLSRQLVTLRTDVPIVFAELYDERTPAPLGSAEDDGGFTDNEPEERDDDPPDEISPPPPADKAWPSPDPRSDALSQRLREAGRDPETAQKTEESDKVDALATVPANDGAITTFEQRLQPGTLRSAYTLAKHLFESRLYTRFPNPQALFAIIIRGREMGLPAMTALDNFHVVEGKPAPHAHLLIARAKAHPDCEYFRYVGGDSTFAEFETKNRQNPSPTRLRYTIEQAERAGLLASRPGKGPGNWIKRPDEMLRKTAAVQLARLEYPDATAGLYAVEELETG